MQKILAYCSGLYFAAYFFLFAADDLNEHSRFDIFAARRSTNHAQDIAVSQITRVPARITTNKKACTLRHRKNLIQ